MVEPAQPSVGWGVLHLFCKTTPSVDRELVLAAIKRAEADDDQVVSAAMLGHKCDIGFMALSDDLWRLRRLQTDLQQAGLDVVDSYVSLTELSEYAQGLPPERNQARLHPVLPPEGNRPRQTSGRPKTASGLAMRKSVPSSISMPLATQGPLTAATIGLG